MPNEHTSTPAPIQNNGATRTHKPDQLDLVDYIQEQQRPKEAYREIFRSVRLPDGRLQHFDYSHLPPEKRPLVWIEV